MRQEVRLPNAAFLRALVSRRQKLAQLQPDSVCTLQTSLRPGSWPVTLMVSAASSMRLHARRRTNPRRKGETSLLITANHAWPPERRAVAC